MRRAFTEIEADLSVLSDADLTRGEIWALVPASSHTLANTVASFNAWVLSHRLSSLGTVCGSIQWVLRRAPRYRMLVLREQAASGGLCLFDVPSSHRRDLAAENHAIAQRSAAQLRGRGLELDAASCTLQAARIGARNQPYQICKVTRQASLAAG